MLLNRICITAGGILSLAFALFHLYLPRLFGWADEEKHLSLKNRRIYRTVNLALAFMFLLLALLSLFKGSVLAADRMLAPWLNGGYALFWLWRAVWQEAYFTPPADAKKTVLHYLLTAVSLLICALYAIPVFHSGN